jgi:hypothetical protein
MDLVDHIELFAGKISEGWSADNAGNIQRFQIIKTEGGPISGTKCYFSLGLSEQHLIGPEKRTCLQELVFIQKSTYLGFPIVGAMQLLANAVIDSARPILRGETVRFDDLVFEGTEMAGLYVTNPVYFDDNFSVCKLSDGREVNFCWLVPITKKEISYIDDTGWSKFEDLLQDKNPDLTDLFRASII